MVFLLAFKLLLLLDCSRLLQTTPPAKHFHFLSPLPWLRFPCHLIGQGREEGGPRECAGSETEADGPLVNASLVTCIFKRLLVHSNDCFSWCS